VFTLRFVDHGGPRTYRLLDGETLIGRAPTCGLVINAPGVSRHHAAVRKADGRAFLRDVGSTYGTSLRGAPVTREQALASGDQIRIGEVTLTFEAEATESEILSDRAPVHLEAAPILRRVDQPSAPVDLTPTPAPASASIRRAGGSAVAMLEAPAPAPAARAAPPGERRRGSDRRKASLGAPAVEQRSGHDRRGGRILHLLAEISRTLVAVAPLPEMLSRVGDVVFEAVPAERVFLLLRDSYDQPLSARVLRNRDGSTPATVSLSRTVINSVMRDRVAMLATDALSDTRLDASASIHAMSIRSFMCAPLWNRNDVIGVLYCDNPLSRRFTPDDLEVFTALSNYAAVAIEQARLARQLLDETMRRERLQRYHSPAVIRRILHEGGDVGTSFMAQERDVTVLFCDIVGFTALCERLTPAAVGEFLNGYFGRMADVIFEHDGTLDKFIGDAILAMFGAPLDQPDHAIRAVTTALAMRRELGRINADRAGTPVRMRMALNSGRALTGDIGSPTRREFTVLGDVVNAASRIEASIAGPDQIVIAETTRALIGDRFKVRTLGAVTLRGRVTSLEVFEVLD
jgi:adenylate cyclase